MTTSAHIADGLPRLLTGDATRAEVLAAAEHLRSCPDCQHELISAVVSHAALTSAHRFAPEVVAPRDSIEVDERTSAEPLPDLGSVFATARAEAAAKSTTTTRANGPEHAGRGWSGRNRVLGIAASAVVLTAAGVTIAETVGTLTTTPTASQTVQLQAFGVGKKPAKATVANGQMRVDATALPRLDGQHFYEVWLTDSARKRMQAVGSIGTDNRAQLTVPANVMGEYSAIEVSLQRTNETGYSGTSVLRGQYAK